MDKKSKILVWIFIALTLLSVGYTFYKTVILQDFEVIDSSEESTEDKNLTEEVDENSVFQDEAENLND